MLFAEAVNWQFGKTSPYNDICNSNILGCVYKPWSRNGEKGVYLKGQLSGDAVVPAPFRSLDFDNLIFLHVYGKKNF